MTELSTTASTAPILSETRAAPSGVNQAVDFLQALFAPGDRILLRPIETWIEGGKKKSQTDYKGTEYHLYGLKNQAGNWCPFPNRLAQTIDRQDKRSTHTLANVFFGTCPRHSSDGQYDQAWQIRTVRALWSDVDDGTPEEAIERCKAAGLPEPSIVVASGRGAHLYWILDEPIIIDDGDPRPVFTEFIDQGEEKKKKPRKFIKDETGEKLWLDIKHNVPALSPKSQQIQDILTGIAAKISGDHTTDLSRLLRVPGTLNRKDQRNGREPVPCRLLEFNPDRRYPLDLFTPLAKESPDKQKREKIAAMPLPRPRKVSAAKADRLADLIAVCSITLAGERSEADFAMCCHAVRNGIAKEDVWTQVEHTGKFAEEGRRYFDLTWENAEQDTRVAKFEKLQKETARHNQKRVGHLTVSDAAEATARGPAAQNIRPTIFVDPANTRVGDTLHQVTDRLLAAGNCFSRAEQLVVINDQQITPILSSPELAGLLNQHVEFFFVDDEGEGEFKPFPPAYGNTWLNHHVERHRFAAIKLFTHNPVYTDDWRLVAPGYDAQSGIYYAGPAIEAQNGTEHLDTLLRDFCFQNPADRTNYLGMLLTAMLVPRFIGSKPAALFNGNQPELGKSVLAQIIAILRDGQSAETASYNPNDEEFEKRLGAIVRRGVTTIIIDNAKSRGQNSRIDSACLERSITDPILSFRLLGSSASIRAENSHIFCITANTPDVSRDLVTRSVVISLFYEGDPKRREFSIADPEDYAQEHRIELLGELIGMVERWKATDRPMAKTHSRFNKRGWGNIVGGILNACGEPDFLANADEVATLLDETRREFAELVSVLVGHPQGIWTASELVGLCGKHGLLTTDLGEGSSRSLATKMGTLAGRFVGERFSLTDGREAVFHRDPDRKGNIYRVSVQEESAEP